MVNVYFKKWGNCTTASIELWLQPTVTGLTIFQTFNSVFAMVSVHLFAQWFIVFLWLRSSGTIRFCYYSVLMWCIFSRIWYSHTQYTIALIHLVVHIWLVCNCTFISFSRDIFMFKSTRTAYTHNRIWHSYPCATKPKNLLNIYSCEPFFSVRISAYFTHSKCYFLLCSNFQTKT